MIKKPSCLASMTNFGYEKQSKAIMEAEIAMSNYKTKSKQSKQPRRDTHLSIFAVDCLFEPYPHIESPAWTSSLAK